MSRINEIKRSLKKDLGATLSSLLVGYDKDLREAKDHLSMKGKTIELANKEQAAWLAYYDERRVELEVIYDYVEKWAEGKRGSMFEHIHSNNPRALSDPQLIKLLMVEMTILTRVKSCLKLKRCLKNLNH